jgi:hypothetical protein
MFYYIIICKVKKIVFLLYYNLFSLLIKKGIKRFSCTIISISYILILKNLDYVRKCYIIIILFCWGGGINYMPGGVQFLNTSLITTVSNDGIYDLIM